MSVYQSRTIQTIILLAYSLFFHHKLLYAACLLLTLLPLHLQFLATLLSIAALSPGLIQLDIKEIVLAIGMLGMHLLFHGVPFLRGAGWKVKVEYSVDSKYMMFPYLLGFSFISLANYSVIHAIALILLFLLLIAYSLNALPVIRALTIFSSLLSSVWAFLTLTVFTNNPYDQSDWFYIVICLTNWMGTILSYSIGHELREEGKSKDPNQSEERPNSDGVYIEMKELEKKDKEEEQSRKGETEYEQNLNKSKLLMRKPYIKREQQSEDMHRRIKSDTQESSLHQLVRNRNHQRSSEHLHIPEIENQRKRSVFNFSDQLTEVTWSEHEGQGEVINLFLLIPFTLFTPSYLEMPIYFYLLLLQSDKTPLWAFYLMFVSVSVITFRAREQATLPISILLRICLIAVVNKNFEAGISITRLLRAIWLRSSFILVLLVFFWFSLLTVNVFHICFVVIVLLFVVKGNSTKPGVPSFRHRHWKYLVILFDIFLLIRYGWSILVESGEQVSQQMLDFLNIMGITYFYNLDPRCFNFVPLLVSATITVQLWTYTSRIYHMETRSSITIPSRYRAILEKGLNIVTIVYYKLIPWASHLLVLVILIKLEFSVISAIIVIWSLAVLWVHMVRPNNLPAYRALHRMWMIFLRLLTVQILLRYAFEFLKFPIIYDHVQAIPLMSTIIQYQQILGLVIRESSNAYLKNIFTKFQLMMALDFCLIAISFLTVQYYEILIAYFEDDSKEQGPDAQPNEDRFNAVEIYEKFIDFKLTEWLANFNEILVNLSRAYLWLYYPILGFFSCLFFSYATFFYFTCCVYYYLKLNQSHYQTDVLTEIQQRVMHVFETWRVVNNIRVNLTGRAHLPNNQSEVEMQEANRETIRAKAKDEGEEMLEGIKQLEKEINITNPKFIFEKIVHLHRQIRFWLLIFTMIFIVLTYVSRFLQYQQVTYFMSESSISNCRYIFYMMGTSSESPIGIVPYLVFVVMTICEIKCCGLVSKNINNFIGRKRKHKDDKTEQTTERKQSSDHDSNEQHQQIQIKSTSSHDEVEPEEAKEKKETLPAHSPIRLLEEGIEEQLVLSESSESEQSERQVKRFVDMEVSLRLGINKILQRFFVLLLVFVSILEDENPFSIIYLFCAWLLNYLGNNSIRGLSWVLSFLVMLEYSIIISDSMNPYVGAQHFQQAGKRCWVIRVLGVTNEQWIDYLSFGTTPSEVAVLFLSFAIIMTYQICFYLQEYNWSRILVRLHYGAKLGSIQSKFYAHFSRIYEYALVYSPLCITTICLGLYLMDFTATNMFLSLLSIVFLFKSFLLENYTNSRPFWKSYFRILQLLIVIFMVVYCVLNTPMYNRYCNRILCSKEQFHTKVTKTILLLILQVGIDLISSHHFINAMATLRSTLEQTSSYYRVAISYVQNDRKIAREFRSIHKKEVIEESLSEVKKFMEDLRYDSSLKFQNSKQAVISSESWLDTVLQLLPSLIDRQLIMSPKRTRRFVKEENEQFIGWLEKEMGRPLAEDEIKNINDLYVNEFGDLKTEQEVKDKIDEILGVKHQRKHLSRRHRTESLQIENSQMRDVLSQSAVTRKSFIGDILPFQKTDMQVVQDALDRHSSIIMERPEEEADAKILARGESRKTLNEHLSTVDKESKKKLLYLLMLESILSNWHYLTYTLMVLEFVLNMGVLTLSFPILTFALGICSPYQATKHVWRLAFLALLPPLFLKFSISIGLISLEPTILYILIGSSPGSITVEYFLIFFIIVQCLILKIVGLYDHSTSDVECMRMALLRNIVNCHNMQEAEEREALLLMLQKSKEMSEGSVEYWFSKRQCKNGYDYSTMMVSVQLGILLYIFCFYDKMAVRQELTFYKMIEYNQFTTGMVIMAFIQLGFILLDRIMTVLQFASTKWDLTLIFKYCILIASLVYVHTTVLVFFPINSGHFAPNAYVTIYYLLHILYFLISSLQVKFGVDKQSRGFMDRYTWYNGFIYSFYRAVPFLFEFKIFSDWTFTYTSLRLFDWIKFEEIFGYLYVAKCNSLFMRGKILGSKIQWWKKLLMGFPLLLAIILLLFGPLILFSSLNPLASFNEVSGGYLELTLKVNHTNEYPFYINTHITDIHFFQGEPSPELEKIIKNYEIDLKSIQVVHLESYSDQYWEISEGSYQKLIEEPLDSLYELTMRVKFERNYTGVTPVYTLNTYTIPEHRVPDFKATLMGNATFSVPKFFPALMRLDNNNGLHFLSEDYFGIDFHAELGERTKKKYWVIDGGINFKVASDKYSKAIFGYSVMSFYISIILVVANYFRFLFQGSAYNIILSDIPYADSLLVICDAIAQARIRADIKEEEMLYWLLIDIMRSPDSMKALTGDYLSARLETLENKED